MTSVSTVAVGANMAAAGAAKARHGMNEAIARLSTGVRSMYGGDAGGASQAHQIRAEGRSAFMAARNAEDGISYLQTAESLLLEIATLNGRLRELAVQKLSTENKELYGSVKPTEISKVLENIEKVKINPSLIQPSKEIKSIGNFDVLINLHSEVQTQIVIKTVPQEESQ